MHQWVIVGTVLAVVLVISGLFLAPKSAIPGTIKKQLTSTLLLPSRQYPVERSSSKYDSSLKVLSFNVKSGANLIAMGEQPSPDQFVDVPQAYQKVLDGMNDYEDLDTAIGTVHLTRPDSLKGAQAAVLNAKGTLLFAKPTSSLSADQWRRFFNSFSVIN